MTCNPPRLPRHPVVADGPNIHFLRRSAIGMGRRRLWTGYALRSDASSGGTVQTTHGS